MAYVCYNGKEVPAKIAKDDAVLCRENCRLNCSAKINFTQRQSFFDSYYHKDVNSKNQFLWGLMEPFQPKQVSGELKNRILSYRYHLTVNGSKIQVCKDAILEIFKIGRKKLDLIRNQITSGLPAPQSDMRGRHDNRPFRIPEEQIESVKNHILMFPTEKSHYSRHKNPNRTYLSSDLNITKMYHLYKEYCSEKRKTPVSESKYRVIFNESFNFGFGVPRSDTCIVCDKEDGDKDAHQAMYKKSFEQQKIDRKNAVEKENVHYMTFDLEKTLPLPKMSTSIAFYLRQLWLYNFGVHYTSSGKPKGEAFLHLWTENEASRGSEEVGSCLLSFFDDLETTGDEKLVTWSDSCAGQNKNFYIISIWQYLIFKKKFSIIEHKFPPVGHTYMDSDRDFGAIEKKLRKYQNIYSVDKYIEIMNSARRINPFKISRMADKFIEVKQIPEKLRLYNRKKDVSGNKYNLRDVRWIRIEKFGEMKIKYDYDETESSWIVVNLLKNKAQPQKENIITLKPTKNIPVQPSKYDDIMKQLQYIPKTKQAFYTNLKRGD